MAALAECRLDRLAHKLAPARFEQEKFGFRHHRRIVRRKLKQLANCFTDRRPAGLARNQKRNLQFLESRREPLYLR